MYLWLTEVQSREIARQAVEGAPLEVCGVIGGVGQRAELIIPVANVADHPQSQYRMEQRALVEALFRLEREGLALIGFYHSHPAGDPIPSPTDVQQAYYPDVAYLIVGLRRREARLAAWNIHEGRVDPVTLHIGEQPPEIEAENKLSRAQVAAIVSSAIIALVLMLVLSLSLLPPAPRIPTP